jgi:hypothetical protein
LQIRVSPRCCFCARQATCCGALIVADRSRDAPVASSAAAGSDASRRGLSRRNSHYTLRPEPRARAVTGAMPHCALRQGVAAGRTMAPQPPPRVSPRPGRSIPRIAQPRASSSVRGSLAAFELFHSSAFDCGGERHAGWRNQFAEALAEAWYRSRDDHRSVSIDCVDSDRDEVIGPPRDC